MNETPHQDEPNRDDSHRDDSHRDDPRPEAWSAPARLISGMAHDARTPLGSVLMMAELLAADPKGTLDPKQVGYAEKIRRAAGEVRDLLEAVNLLAKLAARQIEPAPVPVELRGLVERVAAAVVGGSEASAPATPYDFVRYDATVPERVEVDAERLGQCLEQLLETAQTASPGQVSMRIGVSEGYLACEVTDRGESPGADDLATLFEPFAAGKRRWRSGGGKNLGLPLAHALAHWAGGDLVVVECADDGLTLGLTWPLGTSSS